MSPPANFEDLSAAALKTPVIALLSKVTAWEAPVAAQRAAIARLENVPGRPVIKPGGMENATQPASEAGKPRRGGGKTTARRLIHGDG